MSSKYVHKSNETDEFRYGPKKNVKFIQQTVDAFRTPIFTSKRLVQCLFIFSMLYAVAGAICLAAVSQKFHSIEVEYDDGKFEFNSANTFNLTTSTNLTTKSFQPVPVNTTKEITFQIDQDMPSPLYVHYKLTKFHQNGRMMQKGRYDSQLAGHDPTIDRGYNYEGIEMNDDVLHYFDQCSPLVLHPDYARLGLSTDPPVCKWNETNAKGVPCKIAWPCGLLSFSFFNDVYSCKNCNGGWREKGIAWPQDQNTYRYKNPTVTSAGWDYRDEVKKGSSSKYFHLYQRYPKFPKLKEEGVANEHFQIWMRTSAGSSGGAIRKLYAIIDYVNGSNGTKQYILKKGEEFKILIRSEFNVQQFGGTKSLSLSTHLSYHASIHYGWSFVLIGSIHFIIGLIIIIGARNIPRKIIGQNGQVFIVPKLE